MHPFPLSISISTSLLLTSLLLLLILLLATPTSANGRNPGPTCGAPFCARAVLALGGVGGGVKEDMEDMKWSE